MISLFSGKSIVAAMLLSFMALSSGCASTGSIDNDPLEKMNRAVTKFNLGADRIVLEPVARGYTKVVPQPIRNGVTNFLSNLWEPYTILNNLLQGEFRLAGQDTGRFLINSTLGLLGINDVAVYMDLPRRSEDFGQTMAVWGVPSGPHLVLPLLGPSNIRDGAGLIPQFAYGGEISPNTSPADTTATVVGLLDTRSQFLGLEEILEVQNDKYLFLRESYRQRRANAISNGQGDADAPSEEDLLQELLEDN